MRTMIKCGQLLGLAVACSAIAVQEGSTVSYNGKICKVTTVWPDIDDGVCVIQQANGKTHIVEFAEVKPSDSDLTFTTTKLEEGNRVLYKGKLLGQVTKVWPDLRECRIQEENGDTRTAKYGEVEVISDEALPYVKRSLEKHNQRNSKRRRDSK